jgi:diguanylate cyclase (GGDEF)-like protein
VTDKNSPSGGRWRDTFAQNASSDHLIKKTSEYLRSTGIDIDGEALEKALRDSPLGLALEEMREQLLHAEQKSMIDGLTGIPNRAGFIKALHTHIQAMHEEPEEAQTRTAVAFIDLDGFKQVNDKCGHASGDDALIEVAKRFQKQFEPLQGVIGRIGGDEMVLFLPSNVDAVLNIESEIRQGVDEALEGLVYWDGERPYPIGASIGVHVFDHDTLDHSADNLRDQISHVLEQADTNMYQDKWGDYDSSQDSDPLKAPKNQRLEALRAKYTAQQMPPPSLPENGL